MSVEQLARVFIENAKWFHILAIALILLIRFARVRAFLPVMSIASVLFIIALGNAYVVTAALSKPPGFLTVDTALALQSLSLISTVIYGSIAANLVAFAVTHDA